MSDILLQESGSYLLTENGEPILLESNLYLALNNYLFAGVVSDGLSVSEKIR